MRALQRLHLTGTGDYLRRQRARARRARGSGSQSQPGQRRGQSSGRVLHETEAARLGCQAAAAGGAAVLASAPRGSPRRRPVRADRDQRHHDRGDRLPGRRPSPNVAALLDRTRADSLARRRLRPAYVTISGLVSQRPRKAQIAAPFRVVGELRFPSAPSSASGGTLDGRTSASPSCSATSSRSRAGSSSRAAASRSCASRPSRTPSCAGSRLPAARAAGRGGRPPPASRRGAARAADRHADGGRLRRPVPGFPRTRTSSAATAPSTSTRPRPPRARAGGSSGGSSGGGALTALLAVGGSVLAAGVALVAWAHS